MKRGFDEGKAKRVVIVVFAIVTLLKVLAAVRLDLFADEAFYWQCGQRPDFAYNDLPFMTAMLVKCGAWLFGDTPFGVRSIFLVLGCSIPWLVASLAKPFTSPRDAWLVVGATMSLPLLGILGMTAVPDAPLTFFSLIFILGFERATRTGGAAAWLLTGLSVALGFMTHYRFGLLPLAAGLYLLGTSRGRTLLKTSGPWLAALCGAPGLAPALIFNLRTDWAPLRYFLAVRHSSGYRLSEAAEHLGEQALGATPFLYIGLWMVLIGLWRRARDGDDRSAFFAIFATLPIGLYMVAALLKDSGSQTVHWPMIGYAPLLVFLPRTLAGFLEVKHWSRRLFVFLMPGLAVPLLFLLPVELMTGWFGADDLRASFSGWSEIGAEVRREAETWREETGVAPIIVADNYKLGSNLDFQFKGAATVVILDHSKNYEHGREKQFRVWGIGEAALKARAGDPALLIIQTSETVGGTEIRWLNHIRELLSFDDPVSELETGAKPSSKQLKRFTLYRSVIKTP